MEGGFSEMMEPVALHLLGEPNQRLSSAKELRFGNNGSLCVDLGKGTFFDHEINQGGGVIALVQRELGTTKSDAVEWLNHEQGLASHVKPSAKDESDQTFDYRDESGEFIFQVVRKPGKKFRQRKPDGKGGWNWSVKGLPVIPYRLPELRAGIDRGDAIYVTEGEKDADTLAALGLVATCNSGGSKKWRAEHAATLKGAARVVICEDNDEAGREHARQVAASLKNIADVRILSFPDLPEKGDVSDFVAAGGTAEQIRELAEKASKASLASGEGRKPFKVSPAFQLRDPSQIPPRQWLFDKRLISSFVALTVSPGGIGKSSLTLTEAVAMASSMPLLGAAPARPLRVWLWTGEDTIDEVERRLGAICIQYGVTAEDLGDRLIIDTGRSLPIKLASAERGSVTIDRQLVEEIVIEVKDRQIDVLIIDPFVTIHSVEENANSAINTVVTLVREIADRTSCAIELVHHSAKAGAANSAETGIAQSRGASALVDGVRSARFLAQMTVDDAQKMGIEPEKRRRYFQVIDGKANLAPPVEKALWREMIGVALGNGSGLYPEGDFVGVPVEWTPPDAFEGVTLSDLAAVQDMLGSGEWRVAVQSPHWAGYAVADALGLEAGKGLKKAERSAAHNIARAKASSILRAWEKSGAILKEKRLDKNREEREFYVPGEPAFEGSCSSQTNCGNSTAATAAETTPESCRSSSPPPLGGDYCGTASGGSEFDYGISTTAEPDEVAL